VDSGYFGEFVGYEIYGGFLVDGTKAGKLITIKEA